VNILKNFVIKALDLPVLEPDPDRFSVKMLDPSLINPDPKTLQHTTSYFLKNNYKRKPRSVSVFLNINNEVNLYVAASWLTMPLTTSNLFLSKLFPMSISPIVDFLLRYHN
jgi:hypothetical protein